MSDISKWTIRLHGNGLEDMFILDCPFVPRVGEIIKWKTLCYGVAIVVIHDYVENRVHVEIASTPV